jgi:hypothetical protein
MHVTGLRCGARLLATNGNSEFANDSFRSVIGRVLPDLSKTLWRVGSLSVGARAWTSSSSNQELHEARERQTGTLTLAFPTALLYPPPPLAAWLNTALAPSFRHVRNPRTEDGTGSARAAARSVLKGALRAGQSHRTALAASRVTRSTARRGRRQCPGALRLCGAAPQGLTPSLPWRFARYSHLPP